MKTMMAILARQYFTDLEKDGREDTPENRASWLWFVCPADRRQQVAEEIDKLAEVIRRLDEEDENAKKTLEPGSR